MLQVLDSTQDCLNHMRANPYTRWRHKSFPEGEYIYYDPTDALIHDNTGAVYEDYNGPADGLRSKTGVVYQSDWYICQHVSIRLAMSIYFRGDIPETGKRNRMGCSEDWYNPYFAFAKTFTMGDLDKMSEQEIRNILKIAGKIQEALY